MRIDPVAKLNTWVQVMAFALTVSAALYALFPDKPYQGSLVYSLCIANLSWFAIDFGRHLIPSASQTGWPRGLKLAALTLGGNVFGFVLGTLIADKILGFNTFSLDPRSGLRTALVIAAIASAVITFYFYSHEKSAQLQAQTEQANRQANDARLKLLETQLEPHMLFNTLANLRVLIGTDASAAQRMLDHIIAYLRATLAASRSANHSLQTEFDRLRDYLELMQIRMGPRLTYQLELPANLAHKAIPSLLLQALVENSIKHGLEPKVEGGQITVRASQHDDCLHLEVADTGVGMTTQSAAGGEPHSGFGLAQVRERLATAYGNQATMKFIANIPTGTRISIRFPS